MKTSDERFELTDVLVEFLNELCQSGFGISTEQYIAVHDLLLALVARGKWPLPADHLRNYLAPIVCIDPREQQIFYERFDHWIASQQKLFVSPQLPSEPEVGAASPENSLEPLARRSRPWQWILRAAMTAILVYTIAFLGQAPPDINTLQGKVVTMDSTAVDSAKVTLRYINIKTKENIQAITDRAGGFVLRYTPKDSIAQLEVTHPGFFTHQRVIPLNKSSDTLVIILTPRPTPVPKTNERWWLLEELARIYLTYYDNIRAVMSSLPFLFIVFWWLWQLDRRHMLLEKQSTATIPELQQLVVKGANEELFRGQVFRRTAQQLRRRVEVPSSELNVPATVLETVEKGGWFTPVYLDRKILPEYLVLIDRSTFLDQQARWVDELVGRLSESGVSVDRYYFDGDPRMCRSAVPNAPLLNLDALASRHPGHRLMIFSDGATLLHPLSNRPQRWLELFSRWHDRILLTPEFPDQRGYREIVLASRGFIVLPATQGGLEVLADTLQEDVLPQQLPSNGAAAFPLMLQERPRRYLERHEPDPDTVERLCKQLHDYLGSEGYTWLSACAVYPLLAWDLTLYLGYCLKDTAGKKLINEARLLKLARLPWMRFGNMPDWLRLRLIADLTREQDRAVHRALEELLQSALSQPEGRFEFDIARPPAVLKRRDWQRLLQDFLRTLPEDSILRDYVFLSFMSGKKPRKLTVNVPDSLRRIFFRRGLELLGLQPVAALALACVASLCAWEFLPSPTEPFEQTILAVVILLVILAIIRMVLNTKVSGTNSGLTPLNATQMVDRDRSSTTLTSEAVTQMLKEKGYYDRIKNRTGKGIQHQYAIKTIAGARVVIDGATGLMWQQSGSSNYLTHKQAKAYIHQLNQEKFAGFADWRLPTLEEGMSLMEANINSDGICISPMFDAKQHWIWTSDQSCASAAWSVYFCYGFCIKLVFINDYYVRAVRSGQETLGIKVSEGVHDEPDSVPEERIHPEEVKRILKTYGFFDKGLNETGTGIQHHYEVIVVADQKVVTDGATKLMWQQSGSSKSMKYNKALTYIDQLNREKYAGFSDWRLPSLEEGMSLMEAKKNSEGFYISSKFDAKQRWIWTSDQPNGSAAWYVDFDYGRCNDYAIIYHVYVRAVRSG